MKGLSQTSDHWKKMYIIGAVSGIIALCGIIFDIVFGSSHAADLSSLPETALERFIQFEKDPIMGVYFLDFLNVMINFFHIPFLFAIMVVHRKKNSSLAALAFILYVFGTLFFIANNAALPMYDLAMKYANETDETRKMLLTAAGEGMLARGVHGGPGILPGFIIPGIGSILIAITVIQGKIFNKILTIISLVTLVPLLLYAPLLAFAPGAKDIALLLAMPGGLVMIAWMVLCIGKLFKLSRDDSGI